MSTTSSIGSGKTYPDVATWLAAFATGGWIGEMYNTGEFTITSTITFSGHGTSATNFIRLTTAAGESFQDNANVQTNALRYNVSNGVGIRKTSAYGSVVGVAEDYVTISKLQLSHTGGGNSDQVYNCNGGFSGVVIDSCLGEFNSPNTSGTFGIRLRSGTCLNTLLVNRGTSGSGISFDYSSGGVFVNCTIVRSQTSGGTAITAFGGGGWTVINCAIFGFSTLNSGGTPTSCTNTCSDLAIGFGSSNQASKTYSAQFQSITDATRDFRAKTGADLLNNGTNASASYSGTTVGSSLDIAKTSRPQGAAWDIGCWELISGGGGTVVRKLAAMGVG